MRGVWILALAFAACSTGEVVVDGVTPGLIAPRAAATVTVTGGGFVNALRGSVDDQPFQVLDGWSVTVGAFAASAVVRVDESTLSVELPPLDEGTYDVEVRRPDGKSATLPNGLRVAGDDLGMPDDLTGADLAGVDQSVGDLASQDLRRADLSPPADLTLPPDLAPMCSPPVLAPSVGPGPNLSITLDGIKINGGNQFAHVAAGATFNVTAHYSIKDSMAMMNIDQILLGLAPPGTSAQVCLIDMIVSGTKTGTTTVAMTAPMAPGTYTIRFHYGQDLSCPKALMDNWWTVGGAPTAAEDFAAICVP